MDIFFSLSFLPCLSAFTFIHLWVNSGSWWWTGRPGVLQFMGSQRVGHDWVTELNWDFNLSNSQVVLVVKNPVINASSIPGSERSPGEGNGNTLPYSCLGNPMDWEAWRATVHKSQRVEHDWTWILFLLLIAGALHPTLPCSLPSHPLKPIPSMSLGWEKDRNWDRTSEYLP